MEQELKKTKYFPVIIFVIINVCLIQASCIVIGSDVELKPYLKVVNNYDIPITGVTIQFLDAVFSHDGEISDSYSIIGLNIPKGKSETFTLEHYHKPYNAEVFVFFGDMHSYKEFSFNMGKTATAVLNVDGILE